MKRYLLYILSAFVLVSCAKDWSPEEVLRQEGLVERTWTVAMDDGTRATLDESLRPVWEVGEQLSVYDHVAKVGRLFEVVSVDGNIATVSGSISEGGDLPFDAIYPAKSAGEWTSDGTNTLKLPDTQIIPSGRNVCPDVLVSTAHSDTPDGVVPFHNISSLLKVQVGREDIVGIDVNLVGSSEDDIHRYKVAAASGALATGTYFIAVAPGTYAGGVTVVCADGFGMEYHKSSSNALEAAVGSIKNLGTVSDGAPWRYYRVTDDTKVYPDALDLIDKTGLLGGLPSYLRTYVSALVSSYFPSDNGPVSAISYTYRSADPQGNPVELSALLYLPQEVLNGERGLSGVSLANHGTIASNAECPTEKPQYEGAFAWKNHAVVMPDYYGFGISKDRPQAYLDAETTARGNIDAYFAAVQLMEDRGVATPENLFSFGYSQGGFNAMANLKYVTEHPELGVTFRKTICGGSPFDVPKTWEAYLAGEYRNAIGFVPMTVVSINESQQLNLPYEHLFKEPLLSNWQDWILSKDYTLTQINSYLGTKDLAEVMADEIIAGTGPYFEAILETCRRYSLTSGWTPPPGTTTKIYLYHSTDDDTVPVENFTAMKAFLDETIPDDYESESYANGGHVNACIYYIMNIIDEW
jgi:hypothetical protein